MTPKRPGARSAIVGDAVRARRVAKGWSQAELGRRAGGWTQSMVGRLEAGSVNMTVEQLCDLAGALDVRPGTLLREV